MSQGYPLARLLSAVEERESSIEGAGKGLFVAGSSVSPGEYSMLPNDEAMAMLEPFGRVNSPQMPAWRDILLKCNDEEVDSDDDDGGGIPANDGADASSDDFMSRLDQFRGGFAHFVEEEKAKANVIGTPMLGLLKSGIDMTVRVVRQIEDGEELLRPYGCEWLAIKYVNLKSCALRYLEATQKDKDRTMMIAIDVDSLNASLWTFKVGGGGTHARLAAYLSKKEGKEMIVVSLEELNVLANIIGMTALEYVGNGDDRFDYAWRHNVALLRHDHPRRVVHPASFPSWLQNRSSKKPKKEKKRKHGEVEKLKHGAFDVFRMKG